MLLQRQEKREQADADVGEQGEQHSTTAQRRWRRGTAFPARVEEKKKLEILNFLAIFLSFSIYLFSPGFDRCVPTSLTSPACAPLSRRRDKGQTTAGLSDFY